MSATTMDCTYNNASEQHAAPGRAKKPRKPRAPKVPGAAPAKRGRKPSAAKQQQDAVTVSSMAVAGQTLHLVGVKPEPLDCDEALITPQAIRDTMAAWETSLLPASPPKALLVPAVRPVPTSGEPILAVDVVHPAGTRVHVSIEPTAEETSLAGVAYDPVVCDPDVPRSHSAGLPGSDIGVQVSSVHRNQPHLLRISMYPEPDNVSLADLTAWRDFRTNVPQVRLLFDTEDGAGPEVVRLDRAPPIVVGGIWRETDRCCIYVQATVAQCSREAFCRLFRVEVTFMGRTATTRPMRVDHLHRGYKLEYSDNGGSLADSFAHFTAACHQDPSTVAVAEPAAAPPSSAVPRSRRRSMCVVTQSAPASPALPAVSMSSSGGYFSSLPAALATTLLEGAGGDGGAGPAPGARKRSNSIAFVGSEELPKPKQAAARVRRISTANYDGPECDPAPQSLDDARSRIYGYEETIGRLTETIARMSEKLDSVSVATAATQDPVVLVHMLTQRLGQMGIDERVGYSENIMRLLQTCIRPMVAQVPLNDLAYVAGLGGTAHDVNVAAADWRKMVVHGSQVAGLERDKVHQRQVEHLRRYAESCHAEIENRKTIIHQHNMLLDQQRQIMEQQQRDLHIMHGGSAVVSDVLQQMMAEHEQLQIKTEQHAAFPMSATAGPSPVAAVLVKPEPVEHAPFPMAAHAPAPPPAMAMVTNQHHGGLLVSSLSQSSLTPIKEESEFDMDAFAAASQQLSMDLGSWSNDFTLGTLDDIPLFTDLELMGGGMLIH